MVRALGVICDKAGVQYTCVFDPDATVEEEMEISVPAALTDRGAQLDWLLETTVGFLRRLGPDVVYVKKGDSDPVDGGDHSARRGLGAHAGRPHRSAGRWSSPLLVTTPSTLPIRSLGCRSASTRVGEWL